MKVSILVAVVAAIEGVCGVAVEVKPRHQPRQQSGGVVSAPFSRRDGTRSVENDLRRRQELTKRASTVTQVLDNPPSKLLYYANITIGTPPQKVALQIDTGSSDIWVEVADSQLCQSQGDPCSASGTYNNESSSSYKYVNSLFNIQYADGTQAAGDYATETFDIGGVDVSDMEFGVGSASTSTEGVMGVGFVYNEAILEYENESPYPNLVDQMVSQNLIESQTYSLYLDDLDASTGVILFGGVDTDKFSGTLATLPINVDETNTASAFVITLTGLSLTPPGDSAQGIGASSTYPLNVLLDSGSSYMSLPSAVVSSIASVMGASYSRQLGGYILPNCDQQYESGSLNFFFSGVEIQIPYDEFIVNPTATDGSPFLYNNGDEVCMLGILAESASEDNLAVLGDTFLRSAYVVYDLANAEISLAQTKFNVSASNVEVIPSGKSKVPSAEAVANPTTLTVGQVAASNIGGNTPTGSGGVIATASGSTSSGGGSSSSSAANGFGIWSSKTELVFGITVLLSTTLGILTIL